MDNDKLIKEVEMIKTEIEKKILFLESERGIFAAKKRKQARIELEKLYEMLIEKQAQLVNEQQKLIDF